MSDSHKILVGFLVITNLKIQKCKTIFEGNLTLSVRVSSIDNWFKLFV